MHVSAVQSLPSTGRSSSSAASTMAPLPLQTFVLQSPPVWLPGGSATPLATSLVTQWPAASHANVRQALSVPHWLAAVHWTQVPVALQRVPPPSLHAEFVGSGVCEGAPAVQMSFVQALPSAGTSRSSLTLTS